MVKKTYTELAQDFALLERLKDVIQEMKERGDSDGATKEEIEIEVRKREFLEEEIEHMMY